MRLRVLGAVVLALLAPVLGAETITLIDQSNQLYFVDSAAPATPFGTVMITGLQAGEIIAGIDYRPATGGLYGVGASGSTARLYLIDTATGAATQIGLPVNIPAATAIGVDFDPVTDDLRVISNTGRNVTIDPDTGAMTMHESATFVDGDPNSGTNQPHALGYSNNVSGASSTTLYAITYGVDSVVLARVGSPGGAPISPNSGQVFTIGSTGINSYSNTRTGLDISPTGVAYAAINSPTQLYTVNLTNGAVTLIGPFPVTLIADLAVGGPLAPAPASESVPALSTTMLIALSVMLAAFALTRVRA